LIFLADLASPIGNVSPGTENSRQGNCGRIEGLSAAFFFASWI